MFKNAGMTHTTTSSNEDDVVPQDHYAKIRLRYTTHNNYSQDIVKMETNDGSCGKKSLLSNTQAPKLRAFFPYK